MLTAPVPIVAKAVEGFVTPVVPKAPPEPNDQE